MESDPYLEDETGLCVEDTLLQLDVSGCAQIVVSNPSSYTQVVEHGTTIGQVMTAAVVEAGGPLETRDNKLTWEELGEIQRVSGSDDNIQKKQRLWEAVLEPQLLDLVQKEQLFDFLTDHHQDFCLDGQE